ncbi:MAG: alpha/beta-type small acid-soluble spore protein [Thermoflavifilum sp.]|nr:alpha/beta-type small acid-soluble spore protein [Thermoflavifilum sp.]MCL6512928.1 alpha/beta-type small acid-soluble spore protein [Alicyclobacillus sp.]
MGRRRRLLVPEARAAMDALRGSVMADETKQPNADVADVARQVGVPYNERDNGEMTTRQAGKIGGEIGGSMVRRLIAIAEQQMAERGGPGPRV